MAYPDKMAGSAYDYKLEAGIVLCVEALVNFKWSDFSIKLEDQVLITEDGYEKFSTYPFDDNLIGL